MRYLMLVTGAPRSIKRCAPTFRPFLHPKHTLDIKFLLWDDNLSQEDVDEITRTTDPIDFEILPARNWTAETEKLEAWKDSPWNQTNLPNMFSKCWGIYLANLWRLGYILYDEGFFVERIQYTNNRFLWFCKRKNEKDCT